jgi:3-oxoadipate:acetyl-CoA acetyltransferase
MNNGYPCIITVAITGSVPTKADNPAVPITVAEQIESTHAAFEAGAALVHVHVRNEDGTTSSDPDRFAEFLVGIRRHCPGMIVQFSTGGRSGRGRERGGMLVHEPDMASLTTGSVNFASMVYENHPELIVELATEMRTRHIKPEVEIFDLAMIYNAATLVDKGLLEPPVHVQFVLGIPGALPALRDVLELELAKLEQVLPGSTWTAAGIGRHQLTVNEWALELGGHCRTGLEDNVRLDASTLAPSNAALVRRAAALCAEHDRPVATWRQAREILGLREA